MPSDALVDVGMPAHGRPLFIAEAVASVLGQSHDRLRLTVLDDGPVGEGVEDLLAPFRDDPRLVYVATGRPLSAVEAHTALVQRSDAPYFAFLHDDDRWDRDVLSRRLEYLEAHPEVGMVFGGHRDIDGQGRVIDQPPLLFGDGLVDRGELLRQALDMNPVSMMHSVLVRRSALEAAGPWLAPEFTRLYDWELWFRVALRTPVAHLCVHDVDYRLHEGQMSHVPYIAHEYEELVDHFDQLLQAEAPEHRLSAAKMARIRARQRTSVMLDLAEQGRAGDSLRAARRALQATPIAAASPRFWAGVLAVILGPPGRRLLQRVRLRRHQHHRDQD